MSKEKRDKNGLRLDLSQCAWCGVFYDRATGETVDPPDDIAEGDSFSHGLCKLCGVKVQAEITAEMDEMGTMQLKHRPLKGWLDKVPPTDTERRAFRKTPIRTDWTFEMMEDKRPKPGARGLVKGAWTMRSLGRLPCAEEDGE